MISNFKMKLPKCKMKTLKLKMKMKIWKTKLTLAKKLTQRLVPNTKKKK